MKRILWDDRGYALVLTLLFMPVFIGLSLIIIDLGRGNNAHSDLQAAADAMALAAAGELDSGPEAITRAKLAMVEIQNNVSFLSLQDGEIDIRLNYVDEAGNEYTVIFLTDIPTDDYKPIDQDWVDTHGTLSGSAAKYVYVSARSVDLDTLFPNPVSFVDRDVPINAKAVAGRNAAACGITPLFICNPFEGGIGGIDDLQEAYSLGKMHGRLIKMHPGGANTAGPGNFGFLRISDSGNNVLREYFAMDEGTPDCFDSNAVYAEPGGNSVAPGLNVRFDIWDSPFQNEQKGWGKYTAAKNVRKGYWNASDAGDPDGAQQCSAVKYEGEKDVPGELPPYMAFPENGPQSETAGMSDPTEELSPDGIGTAGAFLGYGSWDIETYFLVNHQIDLTEETDIYDELIADSSLNNFKNNEAQFPGANMPSRYDVYLWEIKKENEVALEGTASLSLGVTEGGAKVSAGESGRPICSKSKGAQFEPSDDPNRRVIQAAIVNCKAAVAAGLLSGASDPVPIEGYASIFLTHPMESGGDGTINAEVLDITGAEGLGTLDSFIRVEADLVR